MSNEVNYMQIVKQTYDEEMEMYMRCTKKKLCEMLIQCNKILSGMIEVAPYKTETIDYPIPPTPVDSITFNGLEYFLKT